MIGARAVDGSPLFICDIYMENKTKRIPIPYKTKSLLQKEISSTCPFCSNEDVDHFHFHHIDENPKNNNVSNILMLCPICHSKITKGDIAREEVEQKKTRYKHEQEGYCPIRTGNISFDF